MAFQSTVTQFNPSGFIGDFSKEGAVRSQQVILRTVDPTNNLIGRAVTLSGGTGNDGIAVAGGSGVFAGILTNSKLYASYGTTVGGPLAPTLQLPNELPVQATTLAPGIWVYLNTSANVGDGVAFRITTGELAAAPGGTPPVGYTLIAGSMVIAQSTTAAGVTQIELLNS